MILEIPGDGNMDYADLAGAGSILALAGFMTVRQGALAYGNGIRAHHAATADRWR